jgi:hypothetical protein
MKLRILLPLSVLAFASLACSVYGNDLGLTRGSGNLVTEAREVSDFSKVTLLGAGDMTITQGDKETLTISAEDNILSEIESEVRGDTLYIGFKKNFNIMPTEPIVIELEIINLEGLKIEGAGKIIVEEIDTPELSVRVDGTGDLELTGITIEQHVDINGAGNYDASELESETAIVKMNGAGNVTIWVTEDLDIEMNGVGSIGYYGNPRVTQDINGVGSIQSEGEK